MQQELSMTSMMLAGVLQMLTRQGKSIRFRVRGPSMHPFIMDGDRVTVSPADSHDLTTGDVVALIHPGSKKLILHRIVRKMGADRLMIKADMQAAADGVFSVEHIAGKVTAVERSGCRLRLGLGPERRCIAWLSRWGLLSPIAGRIHRLLLQ
jgi:SOS-response transcriptional repressor LexA